MGACVSSSRTAQSGSAAANAILPSPVKETAFNGNGSPPINGGVHKSQFTPQSTAAAFRGYGSSKEDTFFDSKAWLDSDTDDDFQSVRGDFTPSRGSTPLHSFRSTPLVNHIDSPPVAVDKTTPNSVPELSPATKKKRLSDLFKESIGNASELAAIFKNNDSESEPDKRTKIIDVLPSSESGSSPQLSGTNSISGRSSNGGNKEKYSKLSPQSCLPSFRSCRPSIERKKKMSSAVAVGT